MSLRQSSTQISDPFAAFADVFPGQPKSAATARGFSCPAGTYGSPNEHCMLYLKGSVFSHVGVDVVDGTIRYSSFTVRKSTLRVGDLVLLWGMPDIEARGDVVVLRWHRIDTIAIGTSSIGKFSLLLGVNRVSVSA
jgi:hypothetical protein